MKTGAGKMLAHVLIPTFFYNHLPYWSLFDSFIIYREYITDQQMLCGSL